MTKMIQQTPAIQLTKMEMFPVLPSRHEEASHEFLQPPPQPAWGVGVEKQVGVVFFKFSLQAVLKPTFPLQGKLTTTL